MASDAVQIKVGAGQRITRLRVVEILGIGFGKNVHRRERQRQQRQERQDQLYF